MADRPDHDLADRLDLVVDRCLMHDTLAADLRAAATRLRQLTDEKADAVSAESVARAVAMSGIAAERDEYRRQLVPRVEGDGLLLPWSDQRAEDRGQTDG